MSRTTGSMYDSSESPIAKINYTWKLDALNRMIRLIISIETDYPIHSVTMSEEDDDVPDLDQMQRKERECSAEHIGDQSEDGEASV
ncbi:hypothetical protein KCU81_g2068, partial [Aureobasidium melanogenum]|uniref:Uncharacterized protein n=1 Tax=Aureobasidium melanogenum (strain CBS 110374) TaxID=1043003 RepID=A0A074VWV5_AURM1